uniref:Coat protein n=1 Tax=Alfalfa mosaic virus TaxID=12321 RepID=A0A2H4R3T1_AMV|nr:coat protein [Alfalfa mosaic virus]
MSSSQKKAGGKVETLSKKEKPKINLRKAQQSKPPTLNVPVTKSSKSRLPQKGYGIGMLEIPLILHSRNGWELLKTSSNPNYLIGREKRLEDLNSCMGLPCATAHTLLCRHVTNVETTRERAVAHGNPMQEFPQGAFRANEKVGFELVFTVSTHAGMQNQIFQQFYAVALCLDFHDVPEGSKNPSYRFNEVWIERKEFSRAGPPRSLIMVGLFTDADDLDLQ